MFFMKLSQNQAYFTYENEVFKLIKKLKKKTTIIIISHKIYLLDECDNIFYLENGMIKDVGDLNKLLKWGTYTHVNRVYPVYLPGTSAPYLLDIFCILVMNLKQLLSAIINLSI